MVICLSIFKDAVITYIYPTVTVFSEKGRREITKNRQSWGLSFCIEGQITYTHNGKTFVSNTENAVLLPKGATYSISGDKEGIFPVINFDCNNLTADTLVIFPLSNTKSYIKDYKKLSNLFLFDNKKLQQFSLLYNIMERLDFEQSKNPLSYIINYIENNISNNGLTNEILAEKMNISEVYLRKLFLSNLGSTPKQYILELRIKKAQRLLVDSNYTVTKISEKCGFSSPYHFCRAFKTKTGMSPTEYAQYNKIYQI